MTDYYREKLFTLEDEAYVGLGITENGEKRTSIPVPWELTAHAFNMKTPDIYIATSDLNDEEVMNKLKTLNVVGCYIFTPLEDYSFISQLSSLNDIYITKGQNLKDLSFLEKLDNVYMIYLEDATLSSLDHIHAPRRFNIVIMRLCLGFYNCKIEDISPIMKDDVKISELVVWNKEEDMDYEKWGSVDAITNKVYVIK